MTTEPQVSIARETRATQQRAMLRYILVPSTPYFLTAHKLGWEAPAPHYRSHPFEFMSNRSKGVDTE